MNDINTSNDTLENVPQPLVMYKEEKFSFRTVVTEDEALGEKIKTKRPTLSLQLPMLTAAGLIHALHTESGMKYILQLTEDAIIAAARDQVSRDTNPVESQEGLDLSKLTIEYLANEPASERKGRGIAKEIWADFVADYVDIMPALINRPKEKVENAAKMFIQKLQPVKGNKVILQALAGYLDTWAANTTNLEAFQECYKFLSEKLDTFLKVTEEDMLASL